MSPRRPADIVSAAGPHAARGGSDGPFLATIAHVPEHPLVPRRRHRVASHRLPLGRPEARGDVIDDGQHGAYDGAELLAA